MNRKSKVIISIIGITIVLLALLGITYAYYLTRIEGNTNINSISITTAKLELVYNDGNGYVIGTDEIIEPGKTFDTKTFTVTNKGNDRVDSYAVILEDVSITNVSTKDITSFESTREGRENDFDLTITCKNQDNEECNGYNSDLLEKNGIILTNSIEQNETQTYTVTLKYQETEKDQSIDMNKKYTGKFNIIDTKDTIDLEGTITNYMAGDYVQTNSVKRVSPIYSDGTYKIVGLETGQHELKVCGKDITNCTSENAKLVETISVVKGDEASVDTVNKTITITDDSRTVSTNIDTSNSISIQNKFNEGILAYTIINNIKSNKIDGGSVFTPNINAVGLVNVGTTADEKILSTAEDDYGTTYYFRGNPIDNFLTFANMCWRIVRINGDGSTKLILENEYGGCNSSSVTSTSGFATWEDYMTMEGTYGYRYEYDKYNQKWIISDYFSEDNEGQYYARYLLNYWFDVKGMNSNQHLIKNDTWCIGDLTNAFSWSGSVKGNIGELIKNGSISFLYLAGNKFYNTLTPSFKCETTEKTGEVDINKVGLLTFDELIYSGAGNYSSPGNSFLNKASDISWWLLNPIGGEGTPEAVLARKGNGFIEGNANNNYYIRPAVTLKSNIMILGGNGTIDNPYVVE